VAQVLLRLTLAFGGILGFFVLLQRSIDLNGPLFFALLFGFPIWLLLIIFLALYQRPRDR
jgi:hypothetical protein